MHLLCQPLDLPASVAEDHGLGDGQRLIQVTQGIQLPLLRHTTLLINGWNIAKFTIKHNYIINQL